MGCQKCAHLTGEFQEKRSRRLREGSGKDYVAFSDNKPVGIKAQMLVSEPVREQPPSDPSIFVCVRPLRALYY